MYSCEEAKIIETNTIASQDYLFAEDILNDLERVVEDAFIPNSNQDCWFYQVGDLNSSDSDTIIIDFGDGEPSSCVKYNKLRRGQIVIVYTGQYKDSLSETLVTFNNYYVNNNWIQGKKMIQNNGRDQNGKVNLKIIDTINITGEKTISIISNKNRIWNNGYYTDTYDDDKYSINGSAHGNSSNGQDYTVIISENLLVNISCINENSCLTTDGQIEIIPLGYDSRYVDYGDGDCDCNATVTLNDEIFPITIY